MAPKAMTFGQQNGLSIVDKVLLSGLVALVGYYGAGEIETYKANQVLRRKTKGNSLGRAH